MQLSDMQLTGFVCIMIVQLQKFAWQFLVVFAIKLSELNNFFVYYLQKLIISSWEVHLTSRNFVVPNESSFEKDDGTFGIYEKRKVIMCSKLLVFEACFCKLKVVAKMI